MSEPDGKPIVVCPACGSLPPDTTAEQDLKSHGQRRINLIWEVTQAIIAIVVTLGTLYVSALLVLRGDSEASTGFLLLSNAFFMIVTSYFQRTNHTRIGGLPVGKEDRDHR